MLGSFKELKVEWGEGPRAKITFLSITDDTRTPPAECTEEPPSEEDQKIAWGIGGVYSFK